MSNTTLNLNCFADVGLTLVEREESRKCQSVLAVSSWVLSSTRLGML